MNLHAVSRSVRVRLLVIALLPMLVLLPLLLGWTMSRWSAKVDDLLISKVNGDLTIADQYLDHLIQTSGERLDALAGSTAFRDAYLTGDFEQYLSRQRDKLGLDFLYLIDANQPGADQWPVIRSALGGKWQSFIDIFSPGQLAVLAPETAANLAIPLVPTEAAVPSDRTEEDRGMVIHSAAPFRLPQQQPMALVGGQVLNSNLDFIDTINALVYREQSLPEGSQGTATLFLEDVRISTNVRLFEDVRALGTRVSSAVRGRVLDEGKIWLDSAFVVNDWYISAYEPLIDSFGNRVGMLYVGFLETPFRSAKMQSSFILVVVFLLIAMLSVPIFLRWAGRIFLPLERMSEVISRVEQGDMNARNQIDEDDNEITHVAHHFDNLLDQVQERDRQLRQLNEELEIKVEERTRDLRNANRKLKQATDRLIMSEKLAAVGEITAGVAHEINNPVAVIQGNLEVARDTLGAEAEKVKTEFNLIDDQVYRISSMVSKLLQFARPSEYSGAANLISPAEVARDCVVLTKKQIEKADIGLETSFESKTLVLIERTELQQVLVNLILNALHATPAGGLLRISATDVGDEVQLRICDSGSGIPANVIKRIFDPFFTTKQARGTGLGLSISQTLISRAGGRITVTSSEGKGSEFTVSLPRASRN